MLMLRFQNCGILPAASAIFNVAADDSRLIPNVALIALVGIHSLSRPLLCRPPIPGVCSTFVVALFGAVDTKTFDVGHTLLGKSGRFVGYAMLSLLFFRALLRTAQIRGRERLAGLRLRLEPGRFSQRLSGSAEAWKRRIEL